MKKQFEYPTVVCVQLNFRENIASSDPGDEDNYLYDNGVYYIMNGSGAGHTFVSSGISCGQFHGQEHAASLTANYYQDFVRNELINMGMPPLLLTNPLQNFINYMSVYGCVVFW